MSETLEQTLPPLTPAEESPPETTEGETPTSEAGESPTPETPNFSKQLQKEQEKRANLERKIDSIADSIKALAERPQTAAVKEEVDELMEEAKKLDEYVPGIGSVLAKMNAKALKEAQEARSEAKSLREQLDSRDAFGEYMADKPAGFREDFTEAEAEMRREAKEAGETVTSRELQLAMKQWAKQWFKDHDQTAPTGTGRASRSVIPAPEARRSAKTVDLAEVYAAGRVPDGRGGTKPGNKLGL